MSPDDALQIVASSCARMQGTLAEHQRVQEALTVVANIVQPQPQPTEETTDGSS